MNPIIAFIIGIFVGISILLVKLVLTAGEEETMIESE